MTKLICPFCKKAYKNAPGLAHHIYSKHKHVWFAGDVLYCPVCGFYAFKTWASFEAHMRLCKDYQHAAWCYILFKRPTTKNGRRRRKYEYYCFLRWLEEQGCIVDEP
ncbi:MAG: C2H2-type zinc finger protein [Candidatus Methanospirareceae archaeon]